MNIPQVAGIKAGALLLLKVKALLELSAIARKSHITGWRHGFERSSAVEVRTAFALRRHQKVPQAKEH
jgi:hypothetical protein